MPTLHSAVDTTKNVFKYLGIAAGIFFSVYLLFQGGVFIKNTYFPEEEPLPEEAFGELPPLSFPANATSKPLTYTIDTVTGDLPLFPERMNIYEIEHREADLLDLKNATAKARAMKFATREKEISDTVFQWSDLKTLSRTFTIDIITGNFVFMTNFITNKSISNTTTYITDDIALREAKKFFTTIGSFPEDIDETLTITKHFTIQKGKRIPSTNEAETKIIEVNYYQQAIEENEENIFPIKYLRPDTSPINALVATGEFNSVVEAHYTYQKISENSSDYYIKFAEDAFQELQDGKGYIASYFGDDAEIKIKEVYLAYYIGEKEQDYLYPIAVFEGSNGFVAYVPIVDYNISEDKTVE